VPPLSLNVQIDILCIRTRPHPLRHDKGTPNLALHKRYQPLSLLRLISILCEHLHVACVGGRAVHGLGSSQTAPHNLGHEAVLEIGERDALGIVSLREKEIPEALGARLALQSIDYWRIDIQKALGGVSGELGLEDMVGGNACELLASRFIATEP
jgi:hypothetical protein